MTVDSPVAAATEAISTYLDNTEGDVAVSITDLLVDLMHLAEHHNLSFPALFDNAAEQFAFEMGFED